MIDEYRHEAAGFTSAFLTSMLMAAVGTHLTLQETVCGIEDLPFDIVDIQGCGGFIEVLQQTAFSADPVVYLGSLLIGLIAALGARYLKNL